MDVRPTAEQLERVEQLAQSIAAERPELALPESYRNLSPRWLEAGPALQLDDLLGDIARLDPGLDCRFYQERARLRAEAGDVIACNAPVVAGSSVLIGGLPRSRPSISRFWLVGWRSCPGIRRCLA